MHLFCVMFSFILNFVFILLALAQSRNQIVEYIVTWGGERLGWREGRGSGV